MNKNLEKLFNLIKENPNIKVITMVNYEISCGDEYSYWLGSIGECCLNKIYDDGEKIHFEDYFDELVGELVDSRIDEEEYAKYSISELEKQAEEEVNNYNWEEVIVVYIELP